MINQFSLKSSMYMYHQILKQQLNVQYKLIQCKDGSMFYLTKPKNYHQMIVELQLSYCGIAPPILMVDWSKPLIICQGSATLRKFISTHEPTTNQKLILIQNLRLLKNKLVRHQVAHSTVSLDSIIVSFNQGFLQLFLINNKKANFFGSTVQNTFIFSINKSAIANNTTDQYTFQQIQKQIQKL